ncbi:hypothetical protein [Mycobacterium sp. URHB0021]
MAMIKAVLPGIRSLAGAMADLARRSGAIVNVSSMALRSLRSDRATIRLPSPHWRD